MLAVQPAPPVATTAARASIQVLGLSVNRAYRPKGSTIRQDSTNACYGIEGPTGSPPSVTAYAYVRVKHVPGDARLTYALKAPWDARYPEGMAFSGKLSGGLFKAQGRQQAEIFGGPTTKDDRFTYRHLPSGIPTSLYVNGKYSMSVSVKVAGQTLHSSGSVVVACP